MILTFGAIFTAIMNNGSKLLVIFTIKVCLGVDRNVAERLSLPLVHYSGFSVVNSKCIFKENFYNGILKTADIKVFRR